MTLVTDSQYMITAPVAEDYKVDATPRQLATVRVADGVETGAVSTSAEMLRRQGFCLT